ncbi:GMC oxidoreductase [Dichomitus squalens]|uniref:GMC oxidoreductase n=1 Tax=Dichomitus squalens TaxID=114155 RepID=A0A4V6MW08_9APHY|nr:GMC oxidoreductase [Dichomitus squalens]
MGYGHSRLLATDPSQYATPWSPADGAAVIPPGEWNSFDYVIVGGGTAGCVLASRLSEDPSVTVLLIEAGTSHRSSFFSRIPMGFPRLFNTIYDWKYRTQPQRELGDRPVDWQRGKILGGSSSINAQLYHECDPADFDSWESQGATGWGYESMRKYFRKAERYMSHPSHLVDPSGHGRDGPWITSHVPIAPISAKVIEAAKTLGIPASNDFNTSEGTLGAGYFVASIDEKHERTSAATAYLREEVLKRPNLLVAISTTTEKILFSSDETGDPTAVGVQISRGERAAKYVVGARKEVILSAGAIGSPQLLLLSGIGPRAHLEKLNIPVVRDLPKVGQNLLDHFSAGALLFRAKPGFTWDWVVYNIFWSAVALVQWLILGTGPLSSLATQVGIFVRSDDPNLPYGESLPVTDMSSGPRAPDIEFAIAPFVVIESGAHTPPRGTHGITAGSVLLKPCSKGSIELRSASVYDHPIIDPNYLSNESDWNVMIRATRLLLRLARAPPLSDALDLRTLSAPGDPLFWPGDADPEKIMDEEIKAVIRRYGQSAWHPRQTSSARMGSSPHDSVVDIELRVHCVRGLRVVDASSFPDQVSGHPCAVVVAMAEKAAELIATSRSQG